MKGDVMHFKKACFFKIFCLVFLTQLVLSANEPTEIEKLYLEKLNNCCTDEERAWYKQQHELYMKSHPPTVLKRLEPYTAYEGSAITRSNSPAIKNLLILINKSLYSNQRAKEKIDRYLNDIFRAYGCQINVEIMEGGTAVGIKKIIKQYYTGSGLDGVIQIGSFPAAWFFDADKKYGGNFTCDLFYEDLDGEWIDNNNNGVYDVHKHGNGDKGPEVFYARIDPGTMGNYGTEVDLLCKYFDKNHNYYLGNIPLKKSALAYIEKDWANSYNYVEKIYGVNNTQVIRYGKSTVSKADYTKNRLTKDYSFLHLWCHSGYTSHNFTNGGSLSHSNIMSIKPKAIGYAHDGCHCADWAAGRGKGFTAGAYVYSNSQTSQVCVSGTKTGQWIGKQGKLFFEELGKNTCFGQAYKIWFDDYIKREGDRNTAYFILWDYGYVILGDPMIKFASVPLPSTHVNQKVSQTNSYNKFLKYTSSVSGQKTTITYSVPKTSFVNLQLYNVSGREVYTLVNSLHSQGRYTVNAVKEEVPDGIYLLSLKAGSYSASLKIKIIK